MGLLVNHGMAGPFIGHAAANEGRASADRLLTITPNPDKIQAQGPLILSLVGHPRIPSRSED